jgi:hypothetical protein
MRMDTALASFRTLLGKAIQAEQNAMAAAANVA